MQQQNYFSNNIDSKKAKSRELKRKPIVNNEKIKATLNKYYDEIKCDDRTRKMLNKKFNGMKFDEIQNVRL